jgi:hypothetical protein
LFVKQWLAERNLGLVPIANAREFDWPGHWLARVQTAEGDHAVVMFGSPSGAFHDPYGALSRGGTIEEGWLLARLDVRLPIEQSYGGARSVGSVAAVLVAPDAEKPLTRVETAQAVAGRGLVGDRYYDGRGTFSRPGRGYHLTLVEAEALESVDLPWEQARRTSSRTAWRSTAWSVAGSPSAASSASGEGSVSRARTSRRSRVRAASPARESGGAPSRHRRGRHAVGDEIAPID